MESFLSEGQIEALYHQPRDTLAKFKTRRKAYTGKLLEGKDSSDDSDMPKAGSSNKVNNIDVQLN